MNDIRSSIKLHSSNWQIQIGVHSLSNFSLHFVSEKRNLKKTKTFDLFTALGARKSFFPSELRILSFSLPCCHYILPLLSNPTSHALDSVVSIVTCLFSGCDLQVTWWYVIYTHTHTYMCVCVYIYIYIYIFIYSYIHIHARNKL